MKLARIRFLFALVLITAAGVAFAVQPAADTAEEPVAPEAEVTASVQDEVLARRCRFADGPAFTPYAPWWKTRKPWLCSSNLSARRCCRAWVAS